MSPSTSSKAACSSAGARFRFLDSHWSCFRVFCWSSRSALFSRCRWICSRLQSRSFARRDISLSLWRWADWLNFSRSSASFAPVRSRRRTSSCAFSAKVRSAQSICRSRLSRISSCVTYPWPASSAAYSSRVSFWSLPSSATCTIRSRMVRLSISPSSKSPGSISPSSAFHWSTPWSAGLLVR